MAQAEHHEHHEEQTNTGLANRKMGFWLFLGSECMFFATLITNYLSNLGRSPAGSPGPEHFNLPVTTISTFVLLMSSLVMALSVYSIQRGDLKKTRLYIALTALFGLVFLGFQVVEFTTFVGEGLTISANIFGSSFFLLTGTHGLHVAIGVLWLISLLVYSFRGGVSQERALDVEIAGLYWHFVDVVWIIIFTVVYLMQRVR